jgi:hypothetical protein
MNEQSKVQINQLPTGVPGLDEILGGGVPEFSFNIIAGAPGCGKTTLAHQFIFANATMETMRMAARALLHRAGRAGAEDAALPAAIHLLRCNEAEQRRALRQPEPGPRRAGARGSTGRDFETGGSRQPEHCGGGLLPDRATQRDARRHGDGCTNIRAAIGAAAHQLGGNHVPDWRVFRVGGARQSRLYRCRWSFLALPTSGPELGRTQDAGHEVARTGFGTGIAHLPHHGGWPAGLFANSWPGWPEEDIYHREASFHGHSGAGRDDGRRRSGGGQPVDRWFLGNWQIADGDAIPCRRHTRR